LIIFKLALQDLQIRNIRPLATCFKILNSHKFSATHKPANNKTEFPMPPLVTSVSSQPLLMLADGNILLQCTPCSDFFAGPSWNVACNLKDTSLPPISPPISRNLASRSTSLLLRPSSSSDDLFENHRRMRPRRATDLQGCAPLILLLPVTGIKPGAVPAGRAQQKRAASSHNRSNLSNHRVAETGYGGYLRLPRVSAHQLP
jgi:hypothetical protein